MKNKQNKSWSLISIKSILDYDNLMKNKQNKSWSLISIKSILKNEIGKKKQLRKKKKKSESIVLTCQTRLTRQTWDLCHESVITK
jgi:hypothetical protein